MASGISRMRLGGNGLLPLAQRPKSGRSALPNAVSNRDSLVRAAFSDPSLTARSLSAFMRDNRPMALSGATGFEVSDRLAISVFCASMASSMFRFNFYFSSEFIGVNYSTFLLGSGKQI